MWMHMVKWLGCWAHIFMVRSLLLQTKQCLCTKCFISYWPNVLNWKWTFLYWCSCLSCHLLFHYVNWRVPETISERLIHATSLVIDCCVCLYVQLYKIQNHMALILFHLYDHCWLVFSIATYWLWVKYSRQTKSINYMYLLSLFVLTTCEQSLS